MSRAAALAACLMMMTTPAAATCRLALALGLDVSGSVDAAEFRLQIDGLAAALEEPEVQGAFLLWPEAHVRVMVFAWSAADHQREIIGWREVTARDDLARMAGRLRATRPAIIDNPGTGLGAALMRGARALRTQADCRRRTLDISGDGPSNTGRHPRDLPPAAMSGLTVNGLVIGPDGRANTTKDLSNVKTLLEYYRSSVIRGPGAFVETARDYRDIARAMRRKLIRELQPVAVSHRHRPGRSVDISDLVGPVALDTAQ